MPEHIIDQIKAGEVLERPASLIKELVENSIDANADEISIHIIENGLDLISIEDNGIGMDFKNLPYAFLRHATSKIKTFDDLYRLHSYGFRGEALASIAASSRVTCQSQPLDREKEGGKLIINGGIEELLVPMKNPRHGTSIYIKNLFYNTPARLKFIKSKTSERIQLKKIIYSFLLSHPEIQFTVKWDEKEKEVYKKLNEESELKNFLQRFTQIVFGRKAVESPILYSESHYEGHRVRVFFTLDAFKNSPNKNQFLFGNNRMFFDKNLHQTIIRNTDSIWKFGESGHYMVLIDTPPDEIDVNVHPNKTQIKFSKNDIVYSLLVTSIKDALKNFAATNTVSSTVEKIDLMNSEPEMLSFITKEEDRFYSLQELRDKRFDSRPNPSSTSQISSQYANATTVHSGTMESPYKFQALTSRYFIFQFENRNFLADKKIILTHYVLSLIEMAREKDENISPLLISEPFEANKLIDQHFEELKKMGFEFDRLNPAIIVLRTIPRQIHRDFIKVVAGLLVKYFTQQKNSHFNADNFTEYVEKNLDLIESIDAHILFRLFESDLKNIIHTSIELKNENLGRFFNE